MELAQWVPKKKYKEKNKRDIFLGLPERARAETGGADQWVLKWRECLGFARVNQVTSASLRYPLSVFNKNSTIKGTVCCKLARAMVSSDCDMVMCSLLAQLLSTQTELACG